MKIVVVVPTLNERENIEPLLGQLLALGTDLHVLVVDDGSVDGTGDIVTSMAKSDPRVHLLARGKRLGYASAIQDGMRWALAQGARLVIQMDADFSHDPKHVPQMVEKSQNCDLVIGSRYIRGGGTRNWGLDRKILSGTANALARNLLRLPVRDTTGGYRCWRRELIENAGILDIKVQGYAFLFVSADLCRRAGARFGEIPIIFTDRQFGKSKMSRQIIFEAIRVLLKLSLRRWQK